MAALLTLLILLAASNFCNATSPVEFINPPPAANPSEYPVWPAQSKQSLEWQTVHSKYKIYAVQDVHGHAVSSQIYYTTNGSGRTTYDWTVDIGVGSLTRSPMFHFAFFEWDTSARMWYDTGYFNVSDGSSLIASEEAASTSSPVSTYTPSSSIATMSSEPLTSSVLETLSASSKSMEITSDLTMSNTDPTPTRTLLMHSGATEHTNPVTRSDKPMASSASNSVWFTGHVNAAGMTEPSNASLHAPRENDMGIWIGVSVGLGVPLVAMIVTSAFWFGKRRETGAMTLY